MSNIYQYIVSVGDRAIPSMILSDEVVTVVSKDQQDALSQLKNRLITLGLQQSVGISLAKIQTDREFFEDIGFKLLKKKDILGEKDTTYNSQYKSKQRNYDQLAQLLRDQGYVCYKKKGKIT